MKASLQTRSTLQRRRAGERGLTMLELLISMTLLVVLTAFLAGGIHLGRRAFSADQMAAATSETAAALDTLHNLIASALPARLGKEGRRIAFEGQSGALNFVGLSAGHALPGGPIRFRIVRINDSVEVQVLPPPGSGTASRNDLRSVTLRAVSDLRLSYFGSLAAGAPPVWRNDWLASDHLPSLVAVTIVFADPRRNRVPLVVALRQS